MKNWKAHGPVLAASYFKNAYPFASWGAQVVKKGNKFYFYVTLDGKNGHFITVAEGDSPTGPFKEINPGKPLVIDSMTKDSHRTNSDIDPTVLIEDDGTSWLAWGQWRLLYGETKTQHGRTGWGLKKSTIQELPGRAMAF